MASRGHTIEIYNRTDQETICPQERLSFLPQAAFDHRLERDVFIAYRSPNPHLKNTKARLKIHWSMDQYTVGHFGRDVFPYVDKVVCISPFHRDYHIRTYGIDPDKITYIDLGVRDDLNNTAHTPHKIPYRCIISSVQDRGLHILRPLWDRIIKAVPQASLVITGDYRLWGNPTANNGRHRAQWLSAENVAFLGKIDRPDYIAELRAAAVMPYPCVFDELFCVSVAEAQTAGVWTITPDIGALVTTNMCEVLAGIATNTAWQNEFVERVIAALLDGVSSPDSQDDARWRFNWHLIAEQWEDLCREGAQSND